MKYTQKYENEQIRLIAGEKNPEKHDKKQQKPTRG